MMDLVEDFLTSYCGAVGTFVAVAGVETVGFSGGFTTHVYV